MSNTISTKQIWFGIFLVIILVGGYTLADHFLVSLRPQSPVPSSLEEKIENIQKTISPYEKKDQLTKLQVFEDISNTVKNNNPTNVIEKSIVSSGNLKEGYLYVRASANSEKLSSGEDVYVKIKGSLDGKHQEFGGHLIESKSLDTPKSDKHSELLFELSDVKYKENYFRSDIEVVSGNWLAMLNRGSNQSVLSFSSTLRDGRIEELSIYYDCVEGERCSLILK